MELKDSNVASKSALCFPLNLKKNLKMLKKRAHTVILHKTESKSFFLTLFTFIYLQERESSKKFLFWRDYVFHKISSALDIYSILL